MLVPFPAEIQEANNLAKPVANSSGDGYKKSASEFRPKGCL